MYITISRTLSALKSIWASACAILGLYWLLCCGGCWELLFMYHVSALGTHGASSMSLRLVKQQLAALTKSQTSPEAAPEDKKGKKLKASAKIKKTNKGNKKKAKGLKQKDHKAAVTEVQLSDEQVVKRNIAYFKRTAASSTSSALMAQA